MTPAPLATFSEFGGLPEDADERRRLLALVPPRLAHRFSVLPISCPPTYLGAEGEEGDGEGRTPLLVLAAADPYDIQAHAAVGREIPCNIRWASADPEEIREGLEELYGVGAATFDELLGESDGEGDLGIEGDEAMLLDGDDEDALVVKFVNQIIRDALGRRATDIHVEPLEDDLRIRYRVDGVLQNATVPPDLQALRAQLVSRLKVMARLDIAERRRPQDGRISLQLDGAPIDVRVATIPSVDGESISLRLLTREKYTLDNLGFSELIRPQVEELLEEPNGIVLVTGPTGSGKSTTLYSFLSALNSEDRRIVTIEDPVEHKLPGVVQIAVKPDIDLTFASGLRSILRGDPNVIMVGEIRDPETAQIAIRSAQTGHLVFSTLHTNDAIGGITRLLDMGIEPYLVATSVRAFFAQRLVRTLCTSCRQKVPIPAAYADAEGVPDHLAEVWEPGPGGCGDCRGTGFHGRMAIYELCRITPELVELITAGASSHELYAAAERSGYQPMRNYGWDKVALGQTTIGEVLQATAADS